MNSKETQHIKEPKSRFYIRRWKATEKELSEIRSFIKSNKAKHNGHIQTVDSESARVIRKKLTD